MAAPPGSLGQACSSHASRAAAHAGVVRPYAIWEAGSGLVLVDDALALTTWAQPQVAYLTASLSDRLSAHLAAALRAVRRIALALWDGGAPSPPPTQASSAVACNLTPLASHRVRPLTVHPHLPHTGRKG